MAVARHKPDRALPDTRTATLVTDDRSFTGLNDLREKAWREGLGVKLRIIHAPESKALEALKHDLVEMRSQRGSSAQRAWRERDEARAKAAFDAKGEEQIKKFILDNIKVPLTFPYRLTRPSIASAKVETVTTEASEHTADGTLVALTADVKTEFDAQVLERIESTTSPTTAFASGFFYDAPMSGWNVPTSGWNVPTSGWSVPTSGSRRYYSAPALPAIFGQNPFLARVLSGTVVVKANATFHPNRYDGLNFDSATLASWDD